MNLFRYSPGNSVFHRIDPRVKLLLVLSVSIAIFTLSNLLLVTGLFVLILIIWGVCGLPLRNLAKLFKTLMFLYVFLIIVQALWYPGKVFLIKPLIPEVVPVIGGSGKITLDGIMHGVMISMRMSVLLSMIPLLTTTTEVEDMVLGLVKVGLPYKYAYMATTAMNMVPTFMEETNVIKNAQLLRACTAFEEGKFTDKMRAYPSLIVPLVIGAMRRAQSMGVAMDARCFAIRKTRTYISDLEWKKSDTVGIVIVVLAVAAMVTGNIVLNTYNIGLFERI